MTDDTETEPARQHGPAPSVTWLAERQRTLIADAERARADRDAQDTAELLESLRRLAGKRLALLASTVCGGERARVGSCTTLVAANCPAREEPCCPRAILAFEEQEAQRALVERLEDQAGVPSAHVKVLTRSLRATEATLAIDPWLKSGKRLLVLAGGVGVGKSVAAAQALVRSPGRWLAAQDLPTLARFENAEKLERYRRARLLVLDDVGAEYADGSGWARTELHRLVHHRFEHDQPTILTTNLSPKAWHAYADERLRDRIAGDGLVVIVGGSSMRRA